MLAIMKGVLHFKTIIFKAPITIFTDNKNITPSKDLKSSSWQRMKIILEEFNHKICFIEGIKNNIADYHIEIFMRTKKIKKLKNHYVKKRKKYLKY